MSVNDRLSRIETRLSSQDVVLEKISNGLDRLIEKMENHHVSLAEAHESLRWVKIVGGSVLSFLSAHAAWLHFGSKNGRP